MMLRDETRTRRLAKMATRTAAARTGEQLLAAACDNLRSAVAALKPGRREPIASALAGQINETAEEVLNDGRAAA